MPNKTYESFWMGSSWVSRCKRCGEICFNVEQEVEHDQVKCSKAKLVPIPEEDKVFDKKPKEGVSDGT